MQATALAWARHFTRPDIEPVILLLVQSKLLEVLLDPYPIGRFLESSEPVKFGVLLHVALKYARADEKDRAGDRVDEGFGIVDDQAPHLNSGP